MSTYAQTPTRTETECVADFLFALLDNLILHPDRLNDALRVSGLTLQDLADAKLRHDNGRARPARRVEAWPNVEREEPCRLADVGAAAANVGTGVSLSTCAPGASNRFTTPPVGLVLTKPWTPRPPDPVRDQTSRERPSTKTSAGRSAPGGRTEKQERDGEKFCSTCGLWLLLADFADGCVTCKTCLKDRRKQRYLRVEKEASIERAALRWYRAHNDPAVSCCVCKLSIDVDEEVVMVGEVRHAACGRAPDSSPGQPAGCRIPVAK